MTGVECPAAKVLPASDIGARVDLYLLEYKTTFMKSEAEYLPSYGKTDTQANDASSKSADSPIGSERFKVISFTPFSKVTAAEGSATSAVIVPAIF